MKKDQNKIAITKLGRASKLATTGAKVGSNYIKHYAKKLVNKGSQEELDEANAKDVYEAFSELKGGPLKMAQMLSLGDQLLPKAYTAQFAQAQNKVTPLSYPLIRKTFKREVGKDPDEVFEGFTKKAVNAASIGQVHKGRLNGKDYAIKLQYPGVADSLKSDLNMVAPMAIKMFGLKKSEVAPYIEEVESKLMEETNYEQEMRNAYHIIDHCDKLKNVVFPDFMPNLSGKRVITMSWMDGEGLADWIKTDPSQKQRNKIGQALWDFYQHQIHELRFMHADPHPGNFIITPKGKLAVIDFGCIKEIPKDFYLSYLKLLQFGNEMDSVEFRSALIELGLYNPDAPAKERQLILSTFPEMFELVGRPLLQDSFDFGNDSYFKEIYTKGEALSRNSDMRGLSAQGSKHFIYFNRTYFGLYQLLNQLKATIDTNNVTALRPLKKSA
ncbi:MAG TPA: ABC transporter [Flavobacteriales bacterium]|nr:AarF/ABC1/UbiB kinase family protein [Flavobacteriales bacterium]HAW19400.1 ABC transporter [Flavobacteriales bacterium]